MSPELVSAQGGDQGSAPGGSWCRPKDSRDPTRGAWADPHPNEPTSRAPGATSVSPHPEGQRQLISRVFLSPRADAQKSPLPPASFCACPPHAAHLPVNSRLSASPCLPTSSLFRSRPPHSLLFILSPTVFHRISYRSPGCFLRPEAPHVQLYRPRRARVRSPQQPVLCLLPVPRSPPATHVIP